jgi:hypothetical protein
VHVTLVMDRPARFPLLLERLFGESPTVHHGIAKENK